MSNIILAAWTQTRWTHNRVPGIHNIKQLVEVEGEVLIERIQRQFPDSIVITNDNAISIHCKKVFRPEHYDCTVATLFSTHELWKEWTTILLGDTNYGANTIELIETQKKPLMFYGDRGEIYAVKWHIGITPLIHFCINELISDPEWKPKFGKLWNLYRVLRGFDFRKEHKIDKYFTFVSDCQDFDTQKEYEKYAKNKKIRRKNTRFLP